MKKTLLFSFAFLLVATVKAQTIAYQPLHGNYTQYLNRYYYWDGTETVEAFAKTI